MTKDDDPWGPRGVVPDWNNWGNLEVPMASWAGVITTTQPQGEAGGGKAAAADDLPDLFSTMWNALRDPDHRPVQVSTRRLV